MPAPNPYTVCAEYRDMGIPLYIRWMGTNEDGVYHLYYGYSPAIAYCKTDEELLKIIAVIATVHQKIKGALKKAS
jgi:hypothetical protein